MISKERNNLDELITSMKAQIWWIGASMKAQLVGGPVNVNWLVLYTGNRAGQYGTVSSMAVPSCSLYLRLFIFGFLRKLRVQSNNVLPPSVNKRRFQPLSCTESLICS